MTPLLGYRGGLSDWLAAGRIGPRRPRLRAGRGHRRPSGSRSAGGRARGALPAHRRLCRDRRRARVPGPAPRARVVDSGGGPVQKAAEGQATIGMGQMAIPFPHIQCFGLLPGARPRRGRGRARTGTRLGRLLPRQLRGHDGRAPELRRGRAAGARLRRARAPTATAARGRARGPGRGLGPQLLRAARAQLRRGVHLGRARERRGAGPGARIAARRRPLHGRGRQRRRPSRRRSQHGLVRDRRRQQRLLRPHRPRRHARDGHRRGAIPPDAGHELARRRQCEQLGALGRQPYRRAQRVRAPLLPSTRPPSKRRAPAGLLAQRARGTNHLFADTSGVAVGRRDVGHGQRLHGPHRSGLPGAHQPLRLRGGHAV